MNLKLRSIDELEEARALLPLLERGASESSSSYLDDAFAAGDGAGFLERCFGRAETLLLVAEAAEGKAQALAVTAPFEDPLTGLRRPMIVVLYVDPDLRHRGVARALVKELRRLLAKRGQEVLFARAGHNDDAVISMGERWGLVRAWELMSTE